MPGKVILVGAGPGDPGLLTLKGREALESADVVLYDRLVGDGILKMIPKGTKKINVGKQSGNHPVPQEEINRLLLDYALDGKTAVRLKGGDSFVFGRGGEELELLYKNNIEFEVIPGVTSATAVPAYAGIPVTHRGASSSLHIVTAHTRDSKEPDIDLRKYAEIGGTLVFLMGAAMVGYIAEGLMDAGMDRYTPCAVIENGTTPRQRKTIGTLCDIEEKAGSVHSPAMIVVGAVCELSGRFDWFSRLPLYGKTIAVTRHEEHSSGLAGRLRTAGANVIECPCIHTESLVTKRMARELKIEVKGYDIIVFTSASGVRAVMEGIYDIGCDARVFGDTRIAVIGSATASALEGYGLRADIIPDKYSGRALGKALSKAAERGGRILMLRSVEANRRLNEILDEAGAEYKEIAVYRTIPECELNITDLINKGKIDYVTFTSGSTVHGFMQFHKHADLSSFTAVCIGDTTAEEAGRCGMSCIISQNASVDSMLNTIIGDSIFEAE